MLQNLDTLIGKKLGASDGDIGHVKDFYFDDRSWMVRYLVADTGAWLTGRQVLLSMHAFGLQPFGLAPDEPDVLRVSLTRKNIEDSPSIDTHRPVSRQHEEEYFRHYGWPVYWGGASLVGDGFSTPVALAPPPESWPDREPREADDIHLRSLREIKGYALHATDGELGKVAGFLVDDRTWHIREMAVEAGHWYAGKEIRVLPEQITRISYEESAVFVRLTKREIEQTARFDVVRAGV